MTTINCICFRIPVRFFVEKVFRNLKTHDIFENAAVLSWTTQRFDLKGCSMGLRINDFNITLNILDKEISDKIDVYLMGMTCIYSQYTRSKVYEWAFNCKKLNPTIPIILAVYDAEKKYDPVILQNAIYAGDYVINRKIGAEFAREIEAVKYIECSDSDHGRGIRTLVDEIVYAGLGKLSNDSINVPECLCNMQ